MSEGSLHDAVAAGALAGEKSQLELLRSITLLDEATGELVFEAVSGEGAGTLVGQRFRADQGVAGWVATSGQPLVLDDVSEDPRFSRDVAESTGYVPKALMAVPLIADEDVLGVLSVLDRSDAEAFGLAQMELLELFARQAAIAVQVVQSARAAERALSGSGDLALVARVAAALEQLEGERRQAGVRLLEALADLLRV